MASFPLGMGLIAPLAGWLSDRFGSRKLTVVGLGLLFAGYLTLTTLDETTIALDYCMRFLLVGLGMGMFQSPNNSAIMGSVPRQRFGMLPVYWLYRAVGKQPEMLICGDWPAGDRN